MEQLKTRIFETKNSLKNYTNQLLKNCSIIQEKKSPPNFYIQYLGC